MDIKRLHEAIKELRAELDRVNLAIQQIEMIARAVDDEQQTVRGSTEEEPPPGERREEKD